PGRTADDRQVVDADRAPAEPLLALHRPHGLMQVFGRAALERVEPAPVERRVVAGEFHRAAEPEAAVPDRDADAALVQHHRLTRRRRRAVVGDRVARAGLDRQLRQAGALRQQRRPRAGGDDDIAAKALAAGRRHAHAIAIFLQARDLAVLINLATGRAHHARQFGDVAVRTQAGVAWKAHHAGHAFAQRRLVAHVGGAVDDLAGHAHFRQRRQLGGKVVESALRPEDVIDALLGVLALQAVTLDPLRQLRARLEQDRRAHR